MHSHIWELCDLLRAEGIGITLLSSGILLKRDAVQLARYCDDVIASLDGPRDPQSHPQPPQSLREVGRRRCRPEVRRSEALCVRSLHRSARQPPALRATVTAAHDLGLNRISFLAADVSTDAFNRSDGWDTDKVMAVALEESGVRALARELDALEQEFAADFASGYIAESPSKLRQRLQQYYAALLGRDHFAPIDCNAPWVSAVIETDGTVRPCFFQPLLGQHQAGGSLRAVLNSDEALRAAVSTPDGTTSAANVCAPFRSVTSDRKRSSRDGRHQE